MRLKPGLLVNVIAGTPAPPAPYIMLTAATSLTAWTNQPPSFGSILAISSAPAGGGWDGTPNPGRAAGGPRPRRGGGGPLPRGGPPRGGGPRGGGPRGG